MRKILVFILILMLSTAAFGRLADSSEAARIGSFSGDGGAAQDDSIKASLDLAHTDLDAMITYDTDTLGLLGLGTGNIFYVDSAKTGTTGLTWATATATLEEAIQLCTANNGDVILIAPGHAETAGTAFVDVDIPGVTIIGLGSGNTMPTFSYDTTTDTFIIGATGDGTKIKNLRFIATVTAVASAIVVEAGCTDFVIEECVFESETTTVDEFIDTIVISGTASDRGMIKNCRFLGDPGTNAGPQSAINFIDCDYLQIIGNHIFGDRAVACIQNETTASNHIVIKDNVLFNGIIGGDAGLNTEPCIELVATTTGTIINNTCICNVATPDLAIVAADCYLAGNVYNENEGSFLEVGKIYTVSMTASVAASTDNMFTVAGGAIEIVAMFGQCTTAMGSNPGDMDIMVDATAGADYDADFTTAVTIDSLGAGDVITWGTTTAGESVLVPTANVNANLTPISWFCPAGVIIQTTTSTGTGAVKWYMSFKPLEPGVTVTPM